MGKCDVWVMGKGVGKKCGMEMLSSNGESPSDCNQKQCGRGWLGPVAELYGIFSFSLLPLFFNYLYALHYT